MKHLKLSEQETARLINRIDEDYENARADHQTRLERFRRYYQKWRNRVDAPPAGKEYEPSFSVPLTQWNVYGALAQEVHAMFGDDAEIIAAPTGPSDFKSVHKISRFMNWRVFHSMNLVRPFIQFSFRKILYGRAFAYMPWKRELWEGPNGPEVDYEGPGFEPLEPDELIVPAERVKCLQEFSFLIRRYPVTPDMLARGEDDGKYIGIKDRWDAICNWARHRDLHDGQEVIQLEQEANTGVDNEYGESARDALVVHEWYGRWRPLRGKKDGEEYDWKARSMYEEDLVVKYIPGLRKIVGVQRLAELYPHLRKRRPFAEAAVMDDGSYWCMGLGEMLESIEEETTANHRLMTRAGQFSVGPLMFYRPGSGFNPENFDYSPGQAIASEDPASVNLIQMRADLNYAITKEQSVLSYAERATGRSDYSLGRATDRPNAPRTASGQLALMEAGNIRVELDTTIFAQDMAAVLGRIWEMDCGFSPESVFFRVTEEEAKGLFDVKAGGSHMTREEFGGKYDFKIKFATGFWNREMEKQRTIELYQLDLQNPLVATNPRALWMITRKAHEALGDPNFGDLMPEPPDLGLPKNPKEEWVLILQGEDCDVNPMDNDDLHLMTHYRQISEEKRAPRQDANAIDSMITHIVEHQNQKRQKMLMQAMVSETVGVIKRQTADPSLGGITAPAVPMSLQALGATIGELTNPGDPNAGQTQPHQRGGNGRGPGGGPR